MAMYSLPSHDSCVCRFIELAHWVYACSISGVLNYIYPAPEQYCSLQPKSMHDLGVWSTWLWLCHYINWKPLHVTYLNWIMYCRATACLHCPCIDDWPARHRMAICHIAEVGAIRLATAAHYNTTGQDLTRPLFLDARYTSNTHFLSDDPYHFTQEG